MTSQDTVHLLKECDSGTKTAVNSIREVLDNTKNSELLKLLSQSLREHEKIGNEIHEMLIEVGQTEKDPGLMARAMSWLKINAKILNEPTDATVAGLMTDGCDMGIKQLEAYKNKYPDADKRAVRLLERIVKEEEHLRESLKEYL